MWKVRQTKESGDFRGRERKRNFERETEREREREREGERDTQGTKAETRWRDQRGEPSSEALTEVNKLVLPQQGPQTRAYTNLHHPGLRKCTQKSSLCGKPCT